MKFLVEYYQLCTCCLYFILLLLSATDKILVDHRIYSLSLIFMETFGPSSGHQKLAFFSEDESGSSEPQMNVALRRLLSRWRVFLRDLVPIRSSSSRVLQLPEGESSCCYWLFTLKSKHLAKEHRNWDNFIPSNRSSRHVLLVFQHRKRIKQNRKCCLVGDNEGNYGVGRWQWRSHLSHYPSGLS